MIENKKSKDKHPSIFEPVALIMNIFLAIVGAVIGMQLMTSLGLTPNLKKRT
jgi:uncharacterized membrane protein YeaQ/YmgE (transglycosylase-associated protein family)